MSDEHVSNLELVQEKVERLIAQYLHVKGELQERETQARGLSQQVDQLKEENNQLKEEIKLLKLAENIELSNADERSDLKKQIDHYIREIDRCIAQLNS